MEGMEDLADDLAASFLRELDPDNDVAESLQALIDTTDCNQVAENCDALKDALDDVGVLLAIRLIVLSFFLFYSSFFLLLINFVFLMFFCSFLFPEVIR
jgi:hypothetical protein